MTVIEHIETAKAAIFGTQPQKATERIGYDMATRFYTPHIETAEPVLQNLMPPKTGLRFQLERAVEFPEYGVFVNLPIETHAVLFATAQKFAKRYQSLLQQKQAREKQVTTV